MGIEDLSASHATRAEISLAAFRSNIDAVRAYAQPGVSVMAVVKANAYGHGAVRMAAEAVAHGVERLAVARYHEGIELREGGVTAPILVFEATQVEHVPTALGYGLDLTIMNRQGLEAVASAARRSGAPARVHVKVDTGMGRLGVADQLAADFVEQAAREQGVEVIGVYSHFATSEDPDRTFAEAQVKRFEAVLEEVGRRKIEVALRHMANSGAIMRMPEAHFDLVRPGIMLYGYPPGHGMPERFPVRPVMSLRSRVSYLKYVDAGVSISYGRRYFTGGRTAIATIPVGYADGYFRPLTNRSSVIIRGRRYPVVGTICMDHIMADLGAVTDVQEGDAVTLIGTDGAESISGWDVAEILGTIPYEVTCAITSRVWRRYDE
ncbi:MAG: Alanine racemase [Bacteroidetes bacterium]|nr:Alanine racemase [Bacteroidota bacterium]MBP1678395.1 Alanine racemase [Bacteroidota bacterium]